MKLTFRCESKGGKLNDAKKRIEKHIMKKRAMNVFTACERKINHNGNLRENNKHTTNTILVASLTELDIGPNVTYV